jgi:hypothetical protein
MAENYPQEAPETFLDMFDDPALQEPVSAADQAAVKKADAVPSGWYQTITPMAVAVNDYEGRKSYRFYGPATHVTTGAQERISFSLSAVPKYRDNGKPYGDSLLFSHAVDAYKKANGLEKEDPNPSAADVLKYVTEYPTEVRIGSNNYVAALRAPKV